MSSPRLYKYRDSYVLYKPIVHTFGTLNWHTLFWYRHTHMTFQPPVCKAVRLAFSCQTSAISFSFIPNSWLHTKMRLQRRLREISLELFPSSENCLFKNLFASLNTVRNTELTFKSFFYRISLKKLFICG